MTLELDIRKTKSGEFLAPVLCEYFPDNSKLRISIDGDVHTYLIQYVSGEGKSIHGRATNLSIGKKVFFRFPFFNITGVMDKSENTADLMFWAVLEETK